MRGRLIAVTFIVTGALLVVASPVSASAPGYPWRDSVEWYPTTTASTGWSAFPAFTLELPNGSSVHVELSEAFYSGGIALDTTNILHQEPASAEGDYGMYYFDVYGLCQTKTTGQISRSASLWSLSWNAIAATAGDVNVSRSVRSTQDCGSTGVPVGVEVYAMVAYKGKVVDVVDLKWGASQKSAPASATNDWCVSVFGPGYTETSTGTYGGQTVTAGDVGCREDKEGTPSTGEKAKEKFKTTCAGAPSPQWLDFSWLGDFVGHYAVCLLVPADGLGALTDPLQEALSTRAPFSVLMVIGDLVGGFGEGYGSGCQGLPNFSAIPGMSLQLDCSPPQSAGFTMGYSLMSILLWSSVVFAVWRMAHQAVGGKE